MKKVIVPLYFIFFIFFFSTKTECQSIKNLETNNGFKNYKLGSKFNMAYGVKRKDGDGVDKVVIDYTKETIGDIPVKTIELYYLKDTLAKIIVKIPPNYYQKLLEGCNATFGLYTADISNNAEKTSDSSASSINYTNNYIWKTKSFQMEYVYYYPKSGTGAYGNTTLHLAYVLNDFPLRLKRVKAYSNPAKNF